MVDTKSLQKIFTTEKEQFVTDWKKFLEFESISTDPTYNAKCLECADWLKEHMGDIGLQAEILKTPTKPVVFGEYNAGDAKPRVLFYGHYDVQPVDPVEEWRSPPFTPELRDGRLYARGAQDNKGQVMFFLKAVETLIKNNALDVSLAVIIEGEEECGSGGIAEAMSDWKSKLKSDVLMLCDTGSRSADVCAITMGLRGIAGLTVKLTGPRTDLHSGVHGGVAPNPSQAMAKLLASLHDENGRIAVPGYYDDVATPNREDLELANSVNVPDEFYQAMSGVKPLGGEKELTFAEKRGFRPTVEINGIHSGYGGPGMKTIIPRDAIAKISTRTVPDQDGAKALEKIEAHLVANAPEGLELTIEQREVGGPSVRVSSKSRVIEKAREVLSDLPVGDVELMWEGASIPIVAELAKVAEAEPLMVGFGLEEDNIHAPNESFSLEQFEKGFLFAASFLANYK